MDISQLQPGQTLFAIRITVSASASAAYCEAVEDGCAIHASERLVPPMAVAALVMGAAMRAISFPSGAVHTGQELEFSRAVPEGAALECSGVLGQNSVRRGTRFLTLEIRAEADGEPAVSGRASIAVPEEGVAQEGDGV